MSCGLLYKLAQLVVVGSEEDFVCPLEGMMTQAVYLL